jgi:hypothetical protein
MRIAGILRLCRRTDVWLIGQKQKKAITIQNQNREHPKDGPEGHRKAFHTGYYKAERVVLPAAGASSGNQYQSGEGPAQENKGAAQDYEEPAKECRRLILAMSEYRNRPAEPSYAERGGSGRMAG